jgi:hypothetical protein
MRCAANWIYRLCFAGLLLAGLIGFAWVGSYLWPSAVEEERPMPPTLQKYLGQKNYPKATEGVPFAKSGPSLEQAIRATGGRVEDALER